MKHDNIIRTHTHTCKRQQTQQEHTTQ